MQGRERITHTWMNMTQESVMEVIQEDVLDLVWMMVPSTGLVTVTYFSSEGK
jgi:hypothetical protein